MIQDLASRIEGDKPLLVKDELPHYASIFSEIFSTFEPCAPTGKPGRPAGPKRVIDEDLVYATVNKTRKGGKIVKVERKLVYGTMKQLNEKLEHSQSITINTSYVERSNSLLRLWDAHLGRKVQTFAKIFDWLCAKLAICIASYNFIRPHGTLSRGNNGHFTPITPAMAANITSQPWTYTDLIESCC
jgi:hypothetical protein